MEMVTVREIVRNKEKTMEECNSTIVSNNRGVIACLWVWVLACRGDREAVGSIVKKTIGVKLG